MRRDANAGAVAVDAAAIREANRPRATVRHRPGRRRPRRGPNPLETDRSRTSFLRRAGLTLASLAILGVVWWGGQKAASQLLPVVRDIRALGPAAPVGFVFAYMLAVILLIPASVMTLLGGALFGLTGGTIYSLVGSTLGSSAAFLLGRYTLRATVAKRLASHPRYAAIERGVSSHGLRIVFLLRLSPVAPFNFLNYALGVTSISFADFVVSSAGMLPGALVYAYFGKVTGEAIVLAGQAQVPHNASYYAMLLAGLAATVAATAVVTRTARRALRDV
jgi:uncharacterized membrane protein YdjX (TVP38/TMEM64 family)